MRNDDPIAFLITWSTYGTWLPGDARGWVEYRQGFQLPDPILELEWSARMSQDACRLAPHQRERVNKQVAETCQHKRWLLHAVNCRSNHVHVVLSSPANLKTIREQLKALVYSPLKRTTSGVGRSELRTEEQLVVRTWQYSLDFQRVGFGCRHRLRSQSARQSAPVRQEMRVRGRSAAGGGDTFPRLRVGLPGCRRDDCP